MPRTRWRDRCFALASLRAVQRAAYFKPEGRRRVFILDGAESMRWDIANVFLKILEEPPESATLILLAPNPFMLLPTIRSRCLQFGFSPLTNEQVEQVLKPLAQWKPADLRLAAQLSGGSPGVAMDLDLEAAAKLRRDALTILERSTELRGASDLFARTAALAKSQDVTFENVLEVFYSLLSDLLDMVCSSSSEMLRNPGLRKELEALSKKVDAAWISKAVHGLDTLHSRLRRNVNRSLGLDAVVFSWHQSAPGTKKEIFSVTQR